MKDGLLEQIIKTTGQGVGCEIKTESFLGLFKDDFEAIGWIKNHNLSYYEINRIERTIIFIK